MSFKARDHEEENNFDAIPKGEYKLQLIKVERKESSTSGNYYQNCQFKVIRGDYKGKIIFHMFHLQNSESCMKIAEGQLSSFMKAVGIESLKDKWDFGPLLNKSFTAKVTIVVDKDGQYDDKNAIARFLPATTKDGKKADSNSGAEPWDNPSTEDKPKKKKKKKKGKKKDKK